MSHEGSHEAVWASMPRRLRVVLVFVALAALIAPMGYVFAGFWTVTGQNLSAVTAERRAVSYLKPLVHLVGALADAQSAAVDGKAVDAEKLRTAVTTIDAVDDREGAALGARQRWSKLRDDIETTLARNPRGHPAYHSYNDLTTPALALVAKVADTSTLATDPDFEAYGTLLRLPGVVVHSGQVAVLLRRADPPAGGSHGGGEPGGSRAGNDQAGKAATAAIAVALDRVATAREAVREGLRRGEAATVTDADALEALDELSAAVDALARVAGPAAEGESVSLEDADDASERVRRAALAFHDQMLGSLDTQLADRQDALSDQRLATALAMVTGLLLAAVLLWLSLPGHPEPRTASSAPVDGGVTGFGDTYGHRTANPQTAPPPEPIDARDLLTSEELLHVGRAVRSTRGEQENGSH